MIYFRNLSASNKANFFKTSYRFNDTKIYVENDSSQSPFIENAYYFLKEHSVKVLSFESCHTIYLRLLGESFPVKYEKMLSKLNEEYKRNKNSIDKIEEQKLCVAYDRISSTYFRAQIKKIEQEKVNIFI